MGCLCSRFPAAQAATFYVSPPGSDSNNGSTPATAFETVARGINQMTAIDTFKIAPGTYHEGPLYDLPSVTPQAPTVIEGTGTQAVDVVFDGDGVRNFAMAFLASSGFTLRNLSFRNSFVSARSRTGGTTAARSLRTPPPAISACSTAWPTTTIGVSVRASATSSTPIPQRRWS